MNLVSELVEALEGIYTDDDGDGYVSAEGMAEIAALIAKVRGAEAESLATPEEIERARSEYADDDINIDDGAAASRADDGVWVAAWVWLSEEYQVDAPE